VLKLATTWKLGKCFIFLFPFDLYIESANSCIDRGSWRNTVVGQGTKLDNMVQIAHNVIIGNHCLIAAQCGIAGSTTVGDFVFIGGQSGIAQHLTIGSNVQIAAKSGIITNVPANSKVGGIPAVPLMQYHRQTLTLKHLSNKN